VDLAPDDISLLLMDPSSSWLARLRTLAGGTLRHLEAGQVLLREGERPTCLWAIQRGAVTLVSTSPSGRRATLAVLGRGGVVGEHGMILNDAHGTDPISLPEARALIATVACSIPFPALRTAMAAEPRVAHWVAVAIGRRVSQVQRMLTRTLAMRVPLRLLGVLEDLADAHGRAGPGGVSIGLPLTQELLASMVGATRESVNRAARELERRGLVRRVGTGYVVASSPAVWGGGRP
jgi:CRP/FNR family transcriptional regulator, cyclic AMP receptor protein